LVASDVLPFEGADESIPAAGFKPVLIRDPILASVHRLHEPEH